MADYLAGTTSKALDRGTVERTTYTPSNWSKATCVPNIFSDAPRRSMKRETFALERTLGRTEMVALEAQLVALKETNEMLTSQFNAVCEERDALRQDRDKWREMVRGMKHPPAAPLTPRRSTLWRRAG
jgi:hypothetical protein